MVEQVFSPVVQVDLGLDESLPRVLDPQDALAIAVREAVEHELRDFLRTSGIPGVAAARLSRLPAGSQKAGRKWLRIRANGQVCRFPDQLLRFVHSYLYDALPSPEMGAQAVLEWLKKTIDCSSVDSRHGDYIVDFFRLTCGQVIKESAALLLAEPQVEAYAASLPRPESRSEGESWPPSPSALLPILRATLTAKLSIGNKVAVAEIFGRLDRSAEDVVEELLDALAPNVIEVCVPQTFPLRVGRGWYRARN